MTRPMSIPRYSFLSVENGMLLQSLMAGRSRQKSFQDPKVGLGEESRVPLTLGGRSPTPFPSRAHYLLSRGHAF